MKTSIPKAAVCAAVAIASAAFAGTHRFSVALNAGGTAAENVPVALRLSTDLVRGFDYATAGDGTHFEIADENGVILPYEIDTWNPGGESLLWVKVPYFLNGRRLAVTYGHTDADMTARAAEVWSDYIGVWHMSATNSLGKYPNSTGDARFDGEVSSFSRTDQAGKFGQSVLIFTNAMHSLNNVPEAKERGGVFIPDGGNLDLADNFTISGWFNHATVDNPAVSGSDKTCAFRYDTIFCKRKHPKANNALNAGSPAGFSLRVNENKSAAGNLVVNGQSNDDNQLLLPRQIVNGAWRHLALSFDAEGHPATWLDGVCVTTHNETILDNDEPLVVGNTSAAYRDNEGNRAWGGYADEVRLRAGVPSAASLAAEYAAMANEHTYGQVTCSLTIDKNEHFADAVIVSSDVPAVSDGEYYAGTTITLTARPNATGTFRKWYGDVPREGWTNATISFVIDRDSWVYARFVHPWALAQVDGTTMTNNHPTTMTDGYFTVNVTVKNQRRHTLILGKKAEAGLSAYGDTGTGTIDLGGPIRLVGDETPWTISEFGGNRGSQSFPASRGGPFRYLSPGTVVARGTSQPFHCGDTGKDKPPLFGASYEMIILDEPSSAITLFEDYAFTSQTNTSRLIVQEPKAGELSGTRIFSSMPLSDTRFDWWDLSSVSKFPEGFFEYKWGGVSGGSGDGSLRQRVPIMGAISLPEMRGVGWRVDSTQYDGGTQLFLMPNVEEISLGGATRETTVTNLCTFAFAGDSSLRKLTLHAAPDIRIGKKIFADKTHNTSNGVEVVDGVTYSTGTQISKGRVPDVIHFTGEAVSETAIANLLDASPVVSTAAKPVVIHASKYQDGWRDHRRSWISAPTAAERAAYPGESVIGVYRAGAAAPSGKAVIIHRPNGWDKNTRQTFLIMR